MNKNKYIAFCECVNTYEICSPSDGEIYTTFKEAVEALREEMPEMYHRHHWMCKVIELNPEGDMINLYLLRSGNYKPSTDQSEWGVMW